MRRFTHLLATMVPTALAGCATMHANPQKIIAARLIKTMPAVIRPGIAENCGAKTLSNLFLDSKQNLGVPIVAHCTPHAKVALQGENTPSALAKPRTVAKAIINGHSVATTNIPLLPAPPIGGGTPLHEASMVLRKSSVGTRSIATTQSDSELVAVDAGHVPIPLIDGGTGANQAPIVIPHHDGLPPIKASTVRNLTVAANIPVATHHIYHPPIAIPVQTHVPKSNIPVSYGN